VGIGSFVGTFAVYDLPPYLRYGVIIVVSTLVTYGDARFE